MNGIKSLKLGYIMSRFPKISETFILYEILAVQELGAKVEIFPLIKENQSVCHKEAEALVRIAHYHKYFSFSILKAQLYFLFLQPIGYLRTLIEVLLNTLKNKNFFIKALIIFPKSVRFAYEMQKMKISHIHAHFATHPTVAAFIIHRLTGIPFSFIAHGSDLHVNRTMLDKKIAASTFAVTCSKFNKELMVTSAGEQMREKIHVIYSGVELDVFSPNFNKPTDRPIQIICVGSFEEVKGHKYLMQACKLLQDRGIKFHCHLVGDGPVRGTIEKLITELRLDDRITIHGLLQRQEVAKILQESDIKAAPSAPTLDGKREGLPCVLIEAMAAGLPIVSTQLTGIPELVDDQHTGFLVEPHNAEELANALQKLCESHELRIQMGKAGRKKVQEGFDRKKNTKTLLKLIVDSQSDKVQ